MESIRPSDQSPDVPDAAAVKLADTLRAAAAGSGAAQLLSASATLFAAGGKAILPATTQAAVRKLAEGGAKRALAQVSVALFEPVAGLGARPIAALGAPPAVARVAASSLGKQAVRAAAKEVFKGAGKAAGIGFVIDGAVATVEAASAVRAGRADRAAAAKHVAKEATTGALATGAGVLLGAGLVALTGGVATPVVFVVGALGSIGAKRFLRRVVK
ncbi:MAG: hypothetical protein KF819_19130 [Labilithrix sp.]|nr:hypothetical protein [Labilithrix sp.]